VENTAPKPFDRKNFRKFYKIELKEGTTFDEWGVAAEPGSAEAYHMTRMRHPLESAESKEEILAYPFPDYSAFDRAAQTEQVRKAHENGLASMGGMQCTIWETAWYVRSMEKLFMDMLEEDEKAEILLDRVTDAAVTKAENFARSGVDCIFLGDDIGMQHGIMMSEELYGAWLKPRLKRVIDAIRAIKPDTIVLYHSCGFVTPFIPHLMDVGVDVLNPVQPECMTFADIYDKFGDRLSFHGTLGTQSTMPFGTPDDVRRIVFENLDKAGDKGGLYITPTHLLEPEVPVENVLAYIQACHDYK
jgi:uroporphyrinogen decarboxylase